MTVTCTNTTTFNIGLNAGTATGATVTTRKMTGPASATLNYKLFRDSARTQNWGNTVRHRSDKWFLFPKRAFAVIVTL